MEPIGRRRWAIAEGYIPPASTGQGRALESHETACLLNAGERDAHVEINDLGVPADTDFASVIESDVPIVVQHTRLDSRQAALALLSTVAYGD